MDVMNLTFKITSVSSLTVSDFSSFDSSSEALLPE